jgi:hypothetical protein
MQDRRRAAAAAVVVADALVALTATAALLGPVPGLG